MSKSNSTGEIKFSYGHVEQVEALWALKPMYSFPIGHILYQQILVDHVDIGYIFVHERFRRQGIASAMLLRLRAWYPQSTICTAVGNEFSTSWLAGNGFVKESAGWFLRPPTLEICPMI